MLVLKTCVVRDSTTLTKCRDKNMCGKRHVISFVKCRDEEY